jgi:hypothetical protein
MIVTEEPSTKKERKDRPKVRKIAIKTVEKQKFTELAKSEGELKESVKIQRKRRVSYRMAPVILIA